MSASVQSDNNGQPGARSDLGLAAGTDRRLARALLPNTIRGKLFLVFAVIVMSAGIGAFFVHRANVLVQTQLTSISGDVLPSLVTADTLSEATTGIRSVAAAMATAESEAALNSRRRLLSEHIDSVKSIVNELGQTGIEQATADRLNGLMSELNRLSAGLASSVSARLQLAHELGRSVRTLASEHAKFNEAIRPLVAQKLEFLNTSSARVVNNTQETVQRLNDISFKGLIPMLAINAQLAQMKEALLSGSTAETEQFVDSSWSKFVQASSAIGRNIDLLKSNPTVKSGADANELANHFQRILDFGVGDENLFDKRRSELTRAAELGTEASEGAAVSAEDVEEAFKQFERLIRLSITLIRGQMVSDGDDLNREISSSLTAMNKASVDGYGALLKLEALGNGAVGILTVAPFAGKPTELEPLRLELKSTNAEFASVLELLGAGAEVADTVNLARRMMAYGQGDGSIFELRTNELKAQWDVEDLLRRTNTVTQQMSLIGADIVDNAREKANSATKQVVGSLSSSRVTLALSIGFSLIAMLGAVFYVNRSLGSRLSAFSNAALALAEGDLRVKLPEPAGHDEVSRLMRALVVFRDTAAEMEASNLREIAQMRQRLVDAIESISEGFSLYDAEDRLVVANDRYRMLLYSGIEDLVVPGTQFETIIRNAAERGLIPEARGRTDAWLAERLAQHRNPSGTHFQLRENGRWIQINERKTEDGSTVAVYLDITELKNREAELTHARDAAEAALSDLQKAQQRLIQAEKMASLGQLTAGIAHEIKNPLNFVNNFAKLSNELIEELQDALKKPIAALDKAAREDAEDLMSTVRENLVKINHHGNRADSIVKNMLMHARQGPSERRKVGINAIAEEALNLAYHGARAEQPGFNIEIVKELSSEVGEVECYPQDLMRVFLNLISNGMYAASKRRAEAGEGFSPKISLTTRANGAETVEIEVRDNGCGIPPELRDRIFIPFFTTKPAGEGTGLGLSLSYDIVVKEHGGDLAVESEPGAFAAFKVTLPRYLPETQGARH